jgi:signal transduction histidine kinase
LQTAAPPIHPRWKKVVPRLAMVAMLSLPVLGLWTALMDTSSTPSRLFRLFVVLFAMIVLGAFVFLRQYFQDQAVIRLLRESRKGYENQKRLQSQLVQKEKLASLGNLVAGAAHEIEHPLLAVMNHSEHLWARGGLTDEQNTLVRKIVHQAGRTRDLVSNLLSFAQQSPGEKSLVDLSSLLNRATQMLEGKRTSANVKIRIVIEPGFPRIHGNVNQLFQAFIEIVENAIDALHDTGGSLEIIAQRLGNEVMVQFSDNGPGIRDPRRVFDPFYTTKPVGKGTGLGLSAVYGVVQDHSGQITCQNKPEGGALFILRFPAAQEPLVQAAQA